MRFSVIISTLNEADYITATIRRIQRIESAAQIIVVDGGSTDTTCRQALHCGAKLVQGPRGRGVQFNHGARVATGDLFLFVHADTLLPYTAFDQLRRHFQWRRNLISTFRLSFDSPSRLLRAYAYFTRFDTLLTTFGDQCISIRKSFFYDLGGFPDWPLFEDVDLLHKARAVTTIASLDASVLTSARRFKRIGVVRAQLINARLLYLYRRGITPEHLAQIYYELHETGELPAGRKSGNSHHHCTPAGQAAENQYENPQPGSRSRKRIADLPWVSGRVR